MEETKKKPIFKKWWFWILVVIVVGAVGSSLSEDEVTPEISEAPQAQENATPTLTEVAKDSEIIRDTEQDESSNTLISEVGGTVTTKNFVITVEDVKRSSGNDFNKPNDGKEFIHVVILIENISEKDYTVSSMLMFNAYYDGFSVNESLGAQIDMSDISTMDGALAAGKKLRGKLSYELPTDWDELEIDVDLTTLSFSNDGEVKIILNN